jgi:hydroxypyruvate reductase
MSGRQVLRRLFLEVLERIRVERVFPERAELEDDGSPLHVVALGKAARPMARSLVDKLGRRPSSGLLVVPHDDDGATVDGFDELSGGHPLPDTGSFAAADVIVDRLAPLGEGDRVVFLLSGGGSALVEKPLWPGVDLAAWKELYRALVESGLGIVEVNALRKHLSAVKGGRLARQAHPARQRTLYVSDVPAAHPSAVASGPTMPDETTVEQCYRIAAEGPLLDRIPAEIADWFRKRTLPETPKPGEAAFSSSRWQQVLSNDDAVEALADEAGRRGWLVEVERSVDDSPVDEALERLLERLDALRGDHPERVVAVVGGGEVRCPVSEPGIGGRNQAFVLRAVPRIAGKPITVLSAGTDGVDGSSPAAGAVADGETLARARAAGLDPDEHESTSDSHLFFDALGDALITGPTGQNVRDVRILVDHGAAPAAGVA